MSHIVIARKYRPQRFDEIVGQGQVTVTLKNAIAQGKIAHAYLFSGPRGVGKTTTARILAKTINCEKYPSKEPCNKCSSCRQISSGSSLDVIEIDAASNRGIEQIRELRENASFAPASAKFKVYIVDEAHQITQDAFNALLKTLEEPPPYIVFVLATTQPEKLPLTILSRCQHFRFRLVADDAIKDCLRKIAASEKAGITDDALEIICSEASGSVRDAESVLEQVISSASGKITREEVEFILGLVESKKVDEIAVAIAEKDIGKVFRIVDDVYRAGYSLTQFCQQIIVKLRNILALKVAGQNPQGFEKIKADRLFWMLDLLGKTEAAMKWSELPRITFETGLYKISSDFISIDEFLRESPPGEESVASPESKIQKREVSRPVVEISEVARILKKEMPAIGKIIEKAVRFEMRANRIYCEFSAEYEVQAKRVMVSLEEIENILRKNGIKKSLEVEISGAKKSSNQKPKLKTTARQLEIDEPIITKMEGIVGGGLEGPVDE